jgi:hypothetical protein
MTNLKTLGLALVLSTAIASPVFAAGNEGPIGSHYRLTPHPGHHHVRHSQHFRGAYNQSYRQTDPDPEFQRNIENFGFSGRDPSRIGGEDPNLHPSPY